MTRNGTNENSAVGFCFPLPLKAAAINLGWSQIRLRILISNSLFSILQKVNDADGIRAEQDGFLLGAAQPRCACTLPSLVPWGRSPCAALPVHSDVGGVLSEMLQAWAQRPSISPALPTSSFCVGSAESQCLNWMYENQTQAPPPIPGLVLFFLKIHFKRVCNCSSKPFY